jgi:hypothetical protein
MSEGVELSDGPVSSGCNCVNQVAFRLPITTDK